MGQQNSKINREIDDSEKEHEKKIRGDIQKLKEKNERKENQSFESKDENKSHEQKLCSADQETAQTETIAETVCPSSSRSTERVAGYRTVDKDKTDYHRDEIIDNGTDILERTDNGEYVHLHSKPLNITAYTDPVVVGCAFLDTENHPLGDEYQPLNTNDTKHDFASDVEQVQQDDCGSEERKINVSINNEKYARGTTGNTSNTAEEKLSDTMIKIRQEKPMKNEVTRTNEEMDTNNQTTSSKLGIYVLYDKRFCKDVLCVENLNRMKGKEFRKLTADCINHFIVDAFSDIINGQSYARVYAIGFKAGSMLMRTFEDVHIIKYILRRQDLRGRYLEYEHFRLATFSLSVFDYEMGERMRLAGSGFFCDADGSVKCFCCGNTYSHELPNSHHPDCASRSSDGHVGRSIADYYGASAHSRLVPSGQNLQEEYRTQAFIDIHIRLTTTSYRLGGTLQFTQDDSLTQENEEDESRDFSVREGPTNATQESRHNANIDVSMLANCLRNTFTQHDAQTQGNEEDERRDFSVREGPTNATQESRHNANIDVSMLANCLRNTDHRNENRTRASTPRAVEDVNSLEKIHAHEGYLGGQSNTGRRTIKEDVNRDKFKGLKKTAKRCNVVMENERPRSKAMCCKCHINRCNIEFVPCGHLVVCNRCVANTTDCPKCGEKIDEGHHVSD